MRIFDLLVIVIVLGIFVGSASIFLVEFNEEYSLNLSDSETQFKSLNRIQAVSGNITTPVLDDVEEQGGEFVPETLTSENFLTVMAKASKLVIEVPKIMFDMISDGFALANKGPVSIPPVLMFGLIGLVTLVVGFGILAFFAKRLL